MASRPRPSQAVAGEQLELNGAEVFTIFGELAEANPLSSDADKG
jgi:hypothetical protein